MRARQTPFPAWPRGCWPNETQRLLVQACVFDDENAARAAWEQWESRVALDSLDNGSHSLLPILFRRLEELGIETPLLGRLQGVARWHWMRYKLLARDVQAVAAGFKDREIPAILLKGAALNGTVFSPGQRPMDDVDVFVYRHQAQSAIDILTQLGWQTAFDIGGSQRAVTHSVPLRNRKTNTYLDLHWDFCHGRFLSDAEQEDLWNHGRPASLGRDNVRILCPADQLLHTCEHGARYNAISPMRWLVDAAHLIKAYATELDWDRLSALATRQRMILPLQHTLDYLWQYGSIELPPEGQRAVASLRPTRSERLEFSLATRKPLGGQPFWQTLPNELFHFRRARRVNPKLRLAEYLRLVNNLSESAGRHAARLTRVAVTGAWTRLLRSVNPFHKSLSFDEVPEEALNGFYPAEMCRRTLFRWSGPTATITLPLRHVPYRVTLQLAKFRDWTDVQQNLQVRVNRTWVTPEDCQFDAWQVSFQVDPTMFVERPEQRLELRCTAWPEATRDPRRLGIPMIGLRFREIAA